MGLLLLVLLLVLLLGLRMLENHLCTAVAGDPSPSDEDLLRVCFAVFDSISSLIPSAVLYLHQIIYTMKLV